MATTEELEVRVKHLEEANQELSDTESKLADLSGEIVELCTGMVNLLGKIQDRLDTVGHTLTARVEDYHSTHHASDNRRHRFPKCPQSDSISARCYCSWQPEQGCEYCWDPGR